MKGKKAKYGIKFYELCSSDGYLLNFEIYPGSKDAGDRTTIENLVCRLIDPYSDKRDHPFMDNYNSIPLCNTLLLRKNHVTGTLRFNRQGIPKEITGKKLKRGEYTETAKMRFTFRNGKTREMFYVLLLDFFQKYLEHKSFWEKN